MSQTTNAINRNGMCYFNTHQTSGVYADVCACNCTHQVKKTEVENAAGVEGAVEENLS